MMSTRSLNVLLYVVLLNYAAQIPYYLHLYYFPRHVPPTPIGVLLLAVTLIWFLVGYLRYRARRPGGWGILVSFLSAQILFYGHSIVQGIWTGGGAIAQLRTSDHFLLIIFLIGYLNFAVAAYYAWQLLRHKAA